MRLLLLAVLALASPPAPEPPMILKETAVTDLGTDPVGVGNLWERTYVLPDGSSRTGMACQLFPPTGDPLVVGAGSEFAAGGRRWRVERVDKPAVGPGSVAVVAVP